MYCTNCGKELHEQAIVCPSCGVPTQNYKGRTKSENKGIKTAVKVLMIIACVMSIYAFLIPLAWTLPMTLNYCERVKHGDKVSTGFKVCTLLFVSVIAGILMLCDD